ncbi:hypothetical protein LJC59_00285 [Desulfovibrio sp. OttesenSCG-928-A18]|nr:hypothetical protein [Desulfovibrio sp. OttesenSCG-928-A18]
MSVTVTIDGGSLSRLKGRLKELLKDPSPGVKIGVMEGTTYSEGPLAGESVAVNLARHEFGTEDIPARAPLRRTVEAQKRDWAKAGASYLSDFASSGKDIRVALIQVGEVAAMDIQQAFEDGLSPPLQEATIRRKEKMGYAAHASKPVILTGQSQRAITAEYAPDIKAVTKGVI